jgi:hypothetical protein
MPSMVALPRLAEAMGVLVERFAEGVEDPAEDDPAAPAEKPSRPRKGKALSARRKGGLGCSDAVAVTAGGSSPFDGSCRPVSS